MKGFNRIHPGSTFPLAIEIRTKELIQWLMWMRFDTFEYSVDATINRHDKEYLADKDGRILTALAEHARQMRTPPDAQPKADESSAEIDPSNTEPGN